MSFNFRKILPGMYVLCLTLQGTCFAREVKGQKPSVNEEWKQQALQLKMQNASFSDVVKRLRLALGRNIVADGDPIKPHVSIDMDATANDVLDIVADAFDYTWTTSKSGIILMNKRFRNPQERPQIHLVEMRQMAQDVLRLLSRLQIDLDPGREHAIDQGITRSFTEEQVKALAGGQSLKLTSMPTSQRELLQEYVYHHHFAQTYMIWNLYLNQLDGLRIGSLSKQRLIRTDPDTGKDKTYDWLNYSMPGGHITFDATREKQP